MFTALVIPDFALQVASCHHGEMRDRPVALLEESPGSAVIIQRGKAPVLQCNAAARMCGVASGMTASQAQARCPHVHLIYRDPAAERAAQMKLLDLAASHTPDYEDTAPGVVCMDWLGLRDMQRRACGLAGEMLAELRGRGLEAKFALAPNPDLAVLAAHLADPTLLLPEAPEDVRAFLAPLPVEVLMPDEEKLALLRLWGVRTLGALTALKRAEIARRLGRDGAELWDHAAGRRQRLLQLVRPQPIFSQSIEFDHPVQQTEPLLFLCRRFLETLCARLEGAWLVAREIRLRLDFENLHDPLQPKLHERALRIAEPCRDVDLLFRLVQTHLEGVTAPSSVTAMTLGLEPVRPNTHQTQLFEGSLRDPNRFAETLAQLEAALGPERVGIPLPATTHEPGVIALEPFEEKEAGEPVAGTRREPLMLGLPVRCFRPPRQARVVFSKGRPVHLDAGEIQGRVLDDRGPWLLSGHWWEPGAWSRREWDVHLSDGTLCKLVFEHGEWSLEGVWG